MRTKEVTLTIPEYLYIARHYPETDWLAWRLMTTIGGTVAIMALLRLMVLLGP